MDKETLETITARCFYGTPVSGPIIPPMYEIRYRCSQCGHEWDDIHVGFNPIEDIQDCRNGCSSGYNEFSLVGLYKTIKGLITGKEPFGYGRLIKSERV